ncbi:MAG: TonB-dependent receptor, partial [Pseudomonadota bacterium]
PTAVPGLELIAAIERTESFGLFQQETTDPDADPPIIEDFAAIGSNNDNEQTVYSLQGRYAVSEQIEFEARTAFVDNEFAIPPTNPIFDLAQDNESFSAEALIRATDIGFLNRAVFGVTYERQTDVGENVPAALPLSFDGEIESVGIFGELEIGVTEKLALIAGARLEIDDRERELTFAADEAELDISDTQIIPRLGLRYDFSEDLTVGYFYSEGYRPGGIDFDFLNLVAGATTYGPETLRQHEVFARARFLDGRATLNVSGFYYEFDDAQISGAGPGGLFGNVPKARGIGGEAEATFALAGGVTVGGALGLLDAKITDPGPNLAEFDGAELPRAPNLTLSGFVAYQSDFGFDARAQIRHIGSRVAALDSPTSPSYTIVDFSAGYEFAVGENAYLRIEAFVQNLADEDVVISAFEDGSEVVGRPRTIGIGGTIRF